MRILKDKTHARKRIQTHTQSHTLTYTDAHRHTHACKDTRIHASVRSRAPTHTKAFFRDRRPEFVEHLPDTVRNAGSIELFKWILKSIVFSQSFEIPVFLNFVSVPLTLFDLFVVEKFPTSPHNTHVSTCAMSYEWNALISNRIHV